MYDQNDFDLCVYMYMYVCVYSQYESMYERTEAKALAIAAEQFS
jgi:hypothetical protein